MGIGDIRLSMRAEDLAAQMDELQASRAQIEHLERTIRWLLKESGSEVVRESGELGLWVEYHEYWSAATDETASYAEQVIAIQDRSWF